MSRANTNRNSYDTFILHENDQNMTCYASYKCLTNCRKVFSHILSGIDRFLMDYLTGSKLKLMAKLAIWVILKSLVFLQSNLQEGVDACKSVRYSRTFYSLTSHHRIKIDYQQFTGPGGSRRHLNKLPEVVKSYFVRVLCRWSYCTLDCV